MLITVNVSADAKVEVNPANRTADSTLFDFMEFLLLPSA